MAIRVLVAAMDISVNNNNTTNEPLLLGVVVTMPEANPQIKANGGRKMARKTVLGLLASALLLLIAVVSISSTDTASGAPAAAPVSPESCSVCHKDAGEKHQASYDELYQDEVIQVTNLAYSFSAPNTSVVTFRMTKNGKPFDANDADALSINFTSYNGTLFDLAASLSLKGKLTCDGTGKCTSTLVGTAPNVSNTPGLIVLYGRDEDVGTLPARIYQSKYPFAAILETGTGIDYVSAANSAGCAKCHSEPFLKHGYIKAQVNGDPSTDFYACKACHLDNRNGSHLDWQLLVDDPPLAAAYLAGEVKLTAEQQAQYAYKIRLMNDVHMSHAMEFPYPQSMANCVTCHEGKLDRVLSDSNFKAETCKSCHAVTGKKDPAGAWDTTKLALNTILPPAIHGSMDLNTTDCTLCHGAGKMAPGFSQIHTGYNKVIYTADGMKYSDAIKVSIDSVGFAGNKLTIRFSAAEEPDIAGLDVAKITPTVLVGLYGWETKNYVVGPHERLTDDNGDGKIDSGDARALEYVVGAKHPRFTTVSAADGKWEVTADISTWAGLVADGTVRRVEIGVLPNLKNAAGTVLALNAPSRTFDLFLSGFDDEFYKPVVKVVNGCNTCHEALATTFHSPDRGGNVTVCRLCHTTTSGGGHLEMQSRSIDSYVHAIHSFQAFDIGRIDFADPVQALEYKHHIEFPYPKHGSTDCESCHVEGTFNVPDQSKSLAGILSASSTLKGRDRNIGTVPSVITGPAARACGGCHRAELINEDEASQLVSFNRHTEMGGYTINAGSAAQDVLKSAWNDIMTLFK